MYAFHGRVHHALLQHHARRLRQKRAYLPGAEPRSAAHRVRTQQGERVAMIAANDCINLSFFHREYYVSSEGRGQESAVRGGREGGDPPLPRYVRLHPFRCSSCFRPTSRRVAPWKIRLTHAYALADVNRV